MLQRLFLRQTAFIIPFSNPSYKVQSHAFQAPTLPACNTHQYAFAIGQTPSCALQHSKIPQVNSPHFLHFTFPQYPQTPQNLLGGTCLSGSSGVALAVLYVNGGSEMSSCIILSLGIRGTSDVVLTRRGSVSHSGG